MMSEEELPPPFQVADLAPSQYLMKYNKDNPQATLDSLKGGYYGPDSECVSSGKAFSGLPQTSQWKPSGTIGSDTQYGAPIAIFSKDGVYENQRGTSHFGHFFGYTPDKKGIIIAHQANGMPYGTSVIPFTGKGGEGDAYSYQIVTTKSAGKPSSIEPAKSSSSDDLFKDHDSVSLLPKDGQSSTGAAQQPDDLFKDHDSTVSLLPKDGQSSPVVEPTWTDRATALGSGILAGAKQYIDPQAEWLARHLGGNPLTNTLGIPDAAQTTAADDAAKLAYENQYGSNPFATAGKLAGQLGTSYAETAPIRAVMTPLALSKMAFAPGASNALSTAVVNVPTWASRGIDLASNALQGGVASGLEGGNALAGAAIGGTAHALGSGMKYIANSGALDAVMNNKLVRAGIDLGSGALGYHYGDLGAAAISAMGAHSLKDAVAPIGNAFMKGVGALAASPFTGAIPLALIANSTDQSGLYPVYDRLGRIVGHSKTAGTATGE